MQREADWPLDVAEIRRRQNVTYSTPEEQQARAAEEWSSRPSGAELDAVARERLPFKGIVPEGQLVRRPVTPGRSLIIDVSPMEGSADLLVIERRKGVVVTRYSEEELSQAGEHGIHVYPRPLGSTADEVIVWLESGRALVEAWSVYQDSKGQALFPCELATGEAPLRISPN